jgi:hypothetical protein
MSQQEQPHDYSNTNQNNPPNINQDNTANIFHIELSLQQSAYLAKFLPNFYSFQLETKPIKRGASSQKIPKEEG